MFVYFKILSYFYYQYRCYSPDIESIRLCSALNPDSSICINHRYGPWLFAIWALCFAEDSILYH
jgi:hypothetical protein